MVTTFLQALGFERDAIISLFYDIELVYIDKGLFFKSVDNNLIDLRIEKNMLPTKQEALYLGKRLTADAIQDLKDAGVTQLSIRPAMLLNRWSVKI